MKIVLSTSNGLRKESVKCAPNGFYIVPVYEPGSFQISVKGPPGWLFEPESHAFTVTDQVPGNDRMPNSSSLTSVLDADARLRV